MPATRTWQLPRRPSVDALLDHIDGHAAPARVAEREEPWWPYRAYPLELTATGPAESSRELSVVARNLSRGGMSFLSKRFLARETRCTMRLRTLEQGRRTVVGAVRRCEPVGGGVHDVGVQFLRPIDTTRFVRIQIAARILIAEDNVVLRRLTSFILERASAVPVTVETGPAAVAAASESFFNLILMAIDLPGLDGLEATRTLRRRGIDTPVIAVTDRQGRPERQACLAAGCVASVAQPINQHELLQLVAENVGTQSPLYSTRATDPILAGPIATFVNRIGATLGVCRNLCQRDDRPGLLAAVRGLKASSAAHGFEPIAEAAGQVERILITSGSGPTHAEVSLSDVPAAGQEAITVRNALADRTAALLTMAARARAGTRLG